MSSEDFFKKLARNLKERNNPCDLKPSIIGKVVQLNPIVVQIESERILLTEGDELVISQWLQFRCDIDKTGALSSDVPNYCSSAKAVSEIHSYTGTACTIPNAILDLANAITAIKNELLALKCVLEVGDYVTIASLDETDKYVLTDKV